MHAPSYGISGSSTPASSNTRFAELPRTRPLTSVFTILAGELHKDRCFVSRVIFDFLKQTSPKRLELSADGGRIHDSGSAVSVHDEVSSPKV